MELRTGRSYLFPLSATDLEEALGDNGYLAPAEVSKRVSRRAEELLLVGAYVQEDTTGGALVRIELAELIRFADECLLLATQAGDEGYVREILAFAHICFLAASERGAVYCVADASRMEETS